MGKASHLNIYLAPEFHCGFQKKKKKTRGFLSSTRRGVFLTNLDFRIAMYLNYISPEFQSGFKKKKTPGLLSSTRREVFLRDLD